MMTRLQPSCCIFIPESSRVKPLPLLYAAPNSTWRKTTIIQTLPIGLPLSFRETINTRLHSKQVCNIVAPMPAASGPKKDYTLTPEAFGKFLQWLSPDHEQAAK